MGKVAHSRADKRVRDAQICRLERKDNLRATTVRLLKFLSAIHLAETPYNNETLVAERRKPSGERVFLQALTGLLALFRSCWNGIAVKR